MPELSFGEPQIVVGIVMAVMTVFLAGLFLMVARSSRRQVEFSEVQRVGYAVRQPWFVSLVILAVAAVMISIAYLPTSKSEGNTFDIESAVTAGQFYWTAAPNSFSAGEHVRFRVTSKDVNHAMGLYDPDGKLLGSVQAMPNKVNNFDVALRTPGKYTISCLEYCGIGHHKMLVELDVKER